MEYVILDIETTGLDLDTTSILEVAALLVVDGVVVSEFESLVQYECEIPATVQDLTQITEEMVANAPKQSDVVARLSEFIGKRPVVAHNGYGFDFPILERAGIRFAEKYDSMEFAFFVLPTAPHGHSMNALAQHYSLGDMPHRALGDCRIEFEVINHLVADCAKRPRKHLAALRYIAQRIGWWWLQMLPGSAEPANISDLIAPYKPYRKQKLAEQETSMLEMPTEPITSEDVEKFFASQVGTASDDYAEDRPEQRQMAATIARAFNTHTHAVIEAGTGTGKSKAYLVPSVLFALKNRLPVIVSTHTKALQDQLFFKEIPHLLAVLGREARITVLKGRHNYVCLRKLQEFVDDMIIEASQKSLYEFGDETRYTRRLAALLLSSWALVTERGDWDEIPYWFKEHSPKRLASDVCNLDELCTKEVCELFDAQKCFLAKARLRAKDADLVIVNHAIILSAIVEAVNELPVIASEDTQITHSFTSTVFPGEAKFIIMDEAHHLEDDATSAWEQSLTPEVFEELMERLFGKGKRRATSDRIAALVSQVGTDRVQRIAEGFYAAESALRLDIKALFDLLPALIDPPEGNYSRQVALRHIPDNLPAKKALYQLLKSMEERLVFLKSALKALGVEADQSLERALDIQWRHVHKVWYALKILSENDSRYVCSVERTQKSSALKAVLLSVAPRLKEWVYDNFSSVVLTSATLAVDNAFNFFDRRCGTGLIERGKVEHHRFNSSFDYARQVQFFVPAGITYKEGEEAHFKKSVAFIESAVTASGGGTLVLCTSHKQVEKLYEALQKPLSRKNIRLLRQKPGLSLTGIIRDFMNDVNSVLIGTETLWQGIDVPGPSLRTLILYKILYRTPTIPIIAARKEELDNLGQDGYRNYYEPLAALALKQGFGRLIRKKTDQGIAIMLEEGLLRKPLLMHSLPDGVRPTKADPDAIYAELTKLREAFAVQGTEEENPEDYEDYLNNVESEILPPPYEEEEDTSSEVLIHALNKWAEDDQFLRDQLSG